ncbi:hypothetical protein D043_2914A, partial [Vibrio parahaemolyticus EKP-021]
MSKVR